MRSFSNNVLEKNITAINFVSTVRLNKSLPCNALNALNNGPSIAFIVYMYVCCWLVLGFYGPLRQYFSLYRAVSQREGERGEKG